MIYVKKNQRAKSRSVALISALGADNGGIGILHSRLVEYKFPKILDEKKYLKEIEHKEKEEKEQSKAAQSKPDNPAAASAYTRVPDEVVIALHKEGRSRREIARLLNISPSTVQRKLQVNGYVKGEDFE